jgi:hypothetical protein
LTPSQSKPLRKTVCGAHISLPGLPRRGGPPINGPLPLSKRVPGLGLFDCWKVFHPKPAASVLRTGFSKVKSNRDVPTMANEEWTKRFLRLACYSPKDTREPRGPEHMAKMKAARGPYSDPRDTYIARTIRHAFESSRGEPLSTGQLVKEIFGWQLRVERKPLKSWHYQNVRRALRKVATPIGRASTRGRSVLWQPDERMGLRDRARHKLARARKYPM